MRSLAIFFLLFPLSILAQNKFQIHGNVQGADNGTLVTLIDPNNPTDTVAKDVVSNGKFELDAEITEPGLFYLQFTPANKKTLFFLDGGDFSVSGSVADIQNMNLTGSAANNDFVSFKQIFNPLFQKLTELNQLRESGRTDDSLRIQYNITYNEVHAQIDSFINAHKSSYVSPFLLVVTSQLNDDIFLLEKRFNSLEENVKQSNFGNYLKDMIENGKFGAVGTQALDFTQTDTNGKPVSLSSFRGKYVLIDFWASWCGPCRDENPNVVQTFNKFKNKNFTVLGVSLDRSKPSWLQAIKEDNLSWTHVSDLKYWSNDVAVKYRIQSIPQNFLVGPDGKIVARNLRGPALEAKLCELLGCN